jgi:hypothetical protein
VTGALDAFPIGAAILDGTTVAAANELFARVLRTTPSAVEGVSLLELLGPEEARGVEAHLAPGQGAAALDGATPADVPAKDAAWQPVAGLAPDGAPWIGELRIGPEGPRRVVLLAASGPPITIDGVPAEGGERLHACPWESLELDRVLSHDIRGGLRGVNSFLTLLTRELGAGATEQALEYLDTAAGAGARTDTMAERLVNLLRVSMRPVTLAPLAFGEVVAEAADRSIGQHPGAPATVEAGDLPTVWSSRVLLVEAVTELITNARKFADGPVRIAVDATPVGGWRYIRLRDDGPGVEPQLAEDAFLPFRLLQPKGRFPGVGMGLPLCRQIVRGHGGRCWIEQQEPPGASVALRLASAPS